MGFAIRGRLGRGHDTAFAGGLAAGGNVRGQVRPLARTAGGAGSVGGRNGQTRKANKQVVHCSSSVAVPSPAPPSRPPRQDLHDILQDLLQLLLVQERRPGSSYTAAREVPHQHRHVLVPSQKATKVLVAEVVKKVTDILVVKVVCSAYFSVLFLNSLSLLLQRLISSSCHNSNSSGRSSSGNRWSAPPPAATRSSRCWTGHSSSSSGCR